MVKAENPGERETPGEGVFSKMWPVHRNVNAKKNPKLKEFGISSYCYG